MLDLCLVQLPNPMLANPKMYYGLGLLYIGAVAKRAGYKVKLIDMRDGLKPIPEAHFTGFSCTTPEVNQAKQLAQNLDSHTIIGGAHASLYPDDCLGYFDTVVVGEGELVILDIMLHQTKGIVQATRIRNLDVVPLPAWSLFKNPFSEELFVGERYGKGERAAAIIASRGCPYNCAFCANLHRIPVIYRSVSDIEQEVKALIDKGITHFRFVDDNFTLHPHLPTLCKMLAEYSIKYRCHTRSNLMDYKKAHLLASSGCEECSIGVESADDIVLEKVDKKLTVADHKRAIGILKDMGIRVKVYWIAGLPGETERTIDLNIKFFDEMKPEKWTLATFTPYPGSRIFKEPEKYKMRIIDRNWANWWNFAPHFVHEYTDTNADVLWDRYQRLYNFFKRN